MGINKYIEKHINYLDKYLSDDYFWGIGIENECYLECSKKKIFDIKTINNKFVPERYSVNYFNTSYKNYPELIAEYTKNLAELELPILINSHTFQNTDIKGNHKTLYTREYKLNNNFEKSLHDILSNKNDFFKNEFGKSFVYDGDTIEFITQSFYKAKVKDTINELTTIKNTYISNLNDVLKKENTIFNNHFDIRICQNNYPLATFMTNINNYAIFNNMTYHINLTLPTQLDKQGNIKDFELFKKKHQNAIKIIQWVEPLLISVFNTPDFLSYIDNANLSKSSQRCAVSRYIGVGTYNTNKMTSGKILLTDDYPEWYNQFHKYTNYKKLDKFGLDINFNKFKNHGIELRFFDYFPEDKLENLLEFLILLLDFSLVKEVENPRENDSWNIMCENIIHNNKGLNTDILNRIFGSRSNSKSPQKYFQELKTHLMKYKGECWDLFI